MSAVAPVAGPAGFGDLLRHWRAVRRVSQLELASAAGTTPRYVSFVETGRSSPSREMVLRLALALDVPLRERNGMLLAAGFAPAYSMAPLGGDQLDRIDVALSSMLSQHEPFPAVVMDRGWTVLRANDGAARLFGTLLAPDPVPERANVLRLMIEPGPVRDAVRNWAEVVPALLERARREAVGGVFDQATARLVQELRDRPEVAALHPAAVRSQSPVPVIDVRFTVGGVDVDFFSVVSTIGTPVDVTAQELRVEAFFPADASSRKAWLALGPQRPR
jgi:transcriptional regulator with XRE-family HTH domain